MDKFFLIQELIIRVWFNL